MADGFLLVSHSGTVLLANRQAARFLGQDEAESLLGRNAINLLTALARDEALWRAELAAAIVQGEFKQRPATGRDGTELARLPSHNAFWFGWYGAYTNTRLLQ